jgi:hypothetical protein
LLAGQSPCASLEASLGILGVASGAILGLFGAAPPGGISLAFADGGTVTVAINGEVVTTLSAEGILSGLITRFAETTKNPDNDPKLRIPEPGEIIYDRQSGEPPKGRFGIYEYKPTNGNGKWYVGSGDIWKRLTDHLDPEDDHPLRSYDDAVWSILQENRSGSTPNTWKAEQTRIQQLGGLDNLANGQKNPISPKGWPLLQKWLQNPPIWWPKWIYWP